MRLAERLRRLEAEGDGIVWMTDAEIAQAATRYAAAVEIGNSMSLTRWHAAIATATSAFQQRVIAQMLPEDFAL